MNDTASYPAIEIDVRPMPPKQRHPLLFATWDALPEGSAILLVNDHDPLPLYYQFAAEHAGAFRWEYLDRGPEIWRVRIARGSFADPGFRPDPGARASCRPAAVPIEFIQALTLDVRPVLEAGGSPCTAIEEALEKLIPGQALRVIAPFEPVPLYTKLGLCGFSHETRQFPDGSWQVLFTPEGDAEPEAFEGCGCHSH